MRRMAPVLEAALALGGIFAVLAMGGSWALVLLLGLAAGAATFLVRRRSVSARQTSDAQPAPSASRLMRAISRRTHGHRPVRTARQQQRHDLWVVAKSLLAIVLLWNAISFVRYVGHDNGDTVSERMATWGRNNHLGSVIDVLEAHMYSTPPSKAPAGKLALAGAVTLPATASTVAPSPGPANPTPAAPGTRSGPAGVHAPTNPVTTPPSPPPVPPAPLTTFFAPPLAGEGQWSAIARAGGQDAMWATSIRPLPAFGGVVASMVVIDQTHLRAGLFNGAEEPGGTWKRANRVPADLQPALVAAMNGGFRFEHIKGGYKTEGVVVKPLRDGDATLAVGRDGRLAMGQLGRDLSDDGSWISLRQNLVLIVDGGTSQIDKGISEGVWWGADYGNKVYVPRSAVCQLADGRLAYLLVGKVDASQLADSLINVGCVKAMQLDINGTWPVFFTFGAAADGTLTGHFLDQRMGGDPGRYLHGSTKEFFAFFDSTLVPASSVLDD